MEKKAKESKQVQKSREKLKKTLEKEHQKFNSESLQAMTKKIRSMISRHHDSSDFLKKRKITLFDENTHTAKTKSKKVIKLQDMIFNTIKKD